METDGYKIMHCKSIRLKGYDDKDILNKQIEILRNIPPEKRLELALELSQVSKELLKEGIRNRHPEYKDKEINLALIRILIGEELFKKVYPQYTHIKP